MSVGVEDELVMQDEACGVCGEVIEVTCRRERGLEAGWTVEVVHHGRFSRRTGRGLRKHVEAAVTWCMVQAGCAGVRLLPEDGMTWMRLPGLKPAAQRGK